MDTLHFGCCSDISKYHSRVNNPTFEGLHGKNTYIQPGHFHQPASCQSLTGGHLYPKYIVPTSHSLSFTFNFGSSSLNRGWFLDFLTPV